jgi:hypothetical protein
MLRRRSYVFFAAVFPPKELGVPGRPDLRNDFTIPLRGVGGQTPSKPPTARRRESRRSRALAADADPR